MMPLQLTVCQLHCFSFPDWMRKCDELNGSFPPYFFPPSPFPIQRMGGAAEARGTAVGGKQPIRILLKADFMNELELTAAPLLFSTHYSSTAVVSPHLFLNRQDKITFFQAGGHLTFAYKAFAKEPLRVRHDGLITLVSDRQSCPVLSSVNGRVLCSEFCKWARMYSWPPTSSCGAAW